MNIEIPDERTARALQSLLERFLDGTKRSQASDFSEQISAETLLRPIYNRLLSRTPRRVAICARCLRPGHHVSDCDE